MTRSALTGEQLGELVTGVYGGRLEHPEIEPAVRRVRGLLYGRFRFEVRIDAPHDELSAGLRIGDYGLLRPFGQPPPMDGDRDSVLVALAMFDEYCRLRIPDDELAAYGARWGS
jgi:hypothetical protein